MAFISNGTSLSINSVVVDVTDISISATSATVEATLLNSPFSAALQGRPVVTGTATIHTDSSTGLTLAQKFSGPTPTTGALPVAVDASGGASGGVNFTGSAIITGYNTTYANDTVHQATVSWQYVGEITASRS